MVRGPPTATDASVYVGGPAPCGMVEVMALAAQVADASTSWMDGFWDDDAALLWDVRRSRHMVRESAWYAVGLLQRGDTARAERTLRAVLTNQFPMDGTPFEGSFRRAPEEADPPDDARRWLHYDPNWRQFIGTTFAVIIDTFSGMLPRALVDDLRASIAGCVAGEPDDRVAPTYANIALMKAWLDTWAGRTDIGESFARETYTHFDAHGGFLEYNSPTYYGIDLWALALWRSSGSAELRRMGTDMEERLWRDVARFYHAGLRNLCGPYDRAYGMDMSAYATPLGLHIWSAVGRERAPFPDTSGRFSHPHDFCFGPLVAAARTLVPDEVVPHLQSFRGERKIDRTISDEPLRVVTAWLGPHSMIGAWSGPPSGISVGQHHRATLHTATGWARLAPGTNAHATASPNTLEISSEGPITLETFGKLELAFETNVQPTETDDAGRHMLRFDAGGPTALVVRTS